MPEGDQVLGMATVTAHAQESMLEAAALEVILKLLLDIPRHRPCLAPPGAYLLG